MTLFDVLFRRMPAARHPNRAGAGEELDELRRLVADGQDPLRLAMADVITVLRGYETGQLSTADAALHRAVALSEELRLPVLRWLVTVLRGTRAALAGALGDAEKLAMEALAQSEATEQPDAVTWFGVQLYMIRYEQGRLDELTDLVDGALSRSPRLYTWHGAGAMAFAELGREDRARELVTVMLDADYPSRQSEPHWLIGMSCLGSAVAELGDGAAAQRLYAALHTSGGQWASIMPLSLGSIERVLGELALAADRAADAERHFRAAIASNDAGPAPSFAARSRLGLLRALRAQGIAMDAAEPAELAAAVEQAADRYGLVRVAQLLERERARR
jgi:tetratricopeptide (TPR) repeat protein